MKILEIVCYCFIVVLGSNEMEVGGEKEEGILVITYDRKLSKYP